MLTTRLRLAGLLILFVSACKPQADESVAAGPALSPSPQPAVASAMPPTAFPVLAHIGRPAPDFSLPDLDGHQVSLGDFKGKVVVLEWFNPGCPFVRAAHTKGSLVDAAQRAQGTGVVWLAINSGAAGQQGHGVEANREGVKTHGLKHPVLLDEDGKVGRSYGAERTPHLFVIDAEGKLAYAGAADNSPDGEGEAPEGGQLVRYVDQALAELAAKRPVSVASSKAYGCSVKYRK
jgi:peroxiredoxin